MSDIRMKMRYRVELSAPLVTQTTLTALQQGDDNANVITASVYDHEEPAVLNGYTVDGYMLKPDGERVMLDGTISGNTVEVALDAYCYQAAGAFMLIIRLKDAEGTKRTILRIAGYIESEGEGPILDPANKLPSWDDVVKQLEVMVKKADEAEEAAQKANEATQNIDEKTQLAEAAAQRAENAAEGAEEAIETAETAAGTANNAAANANSAAANAASATETANTAAANANSAAANATTAAGTANTAAEEAKEAAEMAKNAGAYYTPIMNGSVLEEWRPTYDPNMAGIVVDLDLKGEPGMPGTDGPAGPYYTPIMRGSVLEEWRPSTEDAPAIGVQIDLRGPEGKSPYIGDNGNWYTWDAEAGDYVDTGVAAGGGGSSGDGGIGDDSTDLPEGGGGNEYPGEIVYPVTEDPNMQLVTDVGGRMTWEKRLNLVNGQNNGAVRTTGAFVESETLKHGENAFAEGDNSLASGKAAHAEGEYTTASGAAAHAEGMDTEASGPYSHAEGCGTKSASSYQHVQGKFNVKDTEGKYAHIVGNGKDGLNPSNAHTVDWDGNAWFSGKVFVGGNSMDDGAVELGAGGGAGGGTGGADWNANEGEAGYVKNRTHWVRSGEGFVLEETTLLKSNGMYLSVDPLNSVIADGENYKVTYNGTEYNCTGKNVETEGIIMPVLGNLALLEYGDDTGEPFIFVFPPPEVSAVAFQGATIMGMDTSSDEGCYLSIEGKTMVTYELDGKFVKTAIANALKYYLHILPNDRFNVGEILYVGEWWDDGTPIVRSQPIVDAISTFYPITDTTKGLVYSFTDYSSTKTSVFFETTEYNVDLTGVGVKSIILTSSTPNSKKRFRITVDDSGTISATEYT